MARRASARPTPRRRCWRRCKQSLRRAGFDPGRDDGRVDANTLNAVRAYQQSKGLPVDDDRYINMATVKALGVAP